MKTYKLFLGLAIVSVGALTSCNTDVEGAIYNLEEGVENVSFALAAPTTVSTDEESVSVEVRVNRSNTKGAYTAHYTAEASEDGIFTDSANGQIEFADGVGTAVITVTAANLAKGQDYTYTMTLSDDVVQTADTTLKNQIAQTVVSIHSDYNWLIAGACTFIDYTFSENGSGARNVPIQHAEGTNLYRIVEPWNAVYDDEFEYDSGVQFTYNEDNSIELVYDDAGYVATVSGGGYTDIFVWDARYAGTYCTVSNTGNIYQITLLGIENGDGYYTGFNFAFQWTTGWPGE